MLDRPHLGEGHTWQKNAERDVAYQAAALLQPGMWPDDAAVVGQPDAFDIALAKRIGPLTNLKIRS